MVECAWTSDPSPAGDILYSSIHASGNPHLLPAPGSPLQQPFPLPHVKHPTMHLPYATTTQGTLGRQLDWLAFLPSPLPGL